MGAMKPLAMLLTALSIGTGVLAAGTAVAQGPKGPLLIAGGEFGFANPGWPRFVQVAGGPGATILVIPTASGDPMGNGGRAATHLTSLGAAAELVPLTTDDHAPAKDAAWVAKAERAGGFWFIGGDQGRITAALLNADGSDTPLLAAMRQAHARGAIIGGSSAGAAIMSTQMFKEGPEPLDALRDGLTAGHHTDRGLGFIGDGWFVDQHFLARGRIGRMLVAMRDLGYRHGVGVEEDTGILITDGRTAEVVGSKGVVLVDLDGAEIGKGAPFTIRGAGLSFAGPGDRFDLDSGDITAGPAKLAGSAVRPGSDGFDPYYGAGPFWSPDMLGPGVLLESMMRALDSKAGTAGGIAFGLPVEGTGRNVGFEVTLRRDAGSHGWFASGAGYTIAGLRLDIAPIVMADPLYRKVGE